MTTEVLNADVAIVGAGLVGVSAALALHQAGFSVVLVDSKDPTQTTEFGDAWDTRIYAISPKNAAWLTTLDVWQLLNPARIGEMQAMEIFGDHMQAPIALLASDANADNLGFIVEANALLQALLAQVKSLGIQTLFNHPCLAVNVAPSKATLHFADNKMIEASLLLAADGSHSWVRQQLNMPMQQKSYGQTAIVANFTVEKSHENIARQWFAPNESAGSHILAWLPLPNNTISIVWSVPTKLADSMLKLSEAEFTAQVSSAGNHVLGALTLIGAAAAFPLSLQKTDTLVQDCVVLVGDAAHQFHPMAGQGVNLGFRDVVDLLEVLKKKNQYQTINDHNLLKQYTRSRKADFLNMRVLTDGLYRLFESNNNIVKKVRHWGLAATKHQAVKKILLKQAISL